MRILILLLLVVQLKSSTLYQYDYSLKSKRSSINSKVDAEFIKQKIFESFSEGDKSRLLYVINSEQVYLIPLTFRIVDSSEFHSLKRVSYYLKAALETSLKVDVLIEQELTTDNYDKLLTTQRRSLDGFRGKISVYALCKNQEQVESVKTQLAGPQALESKVRMAMRHDLPTLQSVLLDITLPQWVYCRIKFRVESQDFALKPENVFLNKLVNLFKDQFQVEQLHSRQSSPIDSNVNNTPTNNWFIIGVFILCAVLLVILLLVIVFYCLGYCDAWRIGRAYPKPHMIEVYDDISEFNDRSESHQRKEVEKIIPEDEEFMISPKTPAATPREILPPSHGTGKRKRHRYIASTTELDIRRGSAPIVRVMHSSHSHTKRNSPQHIRRASQPLKTSTALSSAHAHRIQELKRKYSLERRTNAISHPPLFRDYEKKRVPFNHASTQNTKRKPDPQSLASLEKEIEEYKEERSKSASESTKPDRRTNSNSKSKDDLMVLEAEIEAFTKARKQRQNSDSPITTTTYLQPVSATERSRTNSTEQKRRPAARKDRHQSFLTDFQPIFEKHFKKQHSKAHEDQPPRFDPSQHEISEESKKGKIVDLLEDDLEAKEVVNVELEPSLSSDSYQAVNQEGKGFDIKIEEPVEKNSGQLSYSGHLSQRSGTHTFEDSFLFNEHTPTNDTSSDSALDPTEYSWDQQRKTPSSRMRRAGSKGKRERRQQIAQQKQQRKSGTVYLTGHDNGPVSPSLSKFGGRYHAMAPAYHR